MKNIEKTYKSIMSTIRKHRKVNDRVSELENKGFVVCECPMGVGGVGQVKEMADHYRIQIGYGLGKHNYAMAVKLAKNTECK